MKRAIKGFRMLDVGTRRKFRRMLLEQYGPYCQLCLAWGKSKDFARIKIDVLEDKRSLSIDHIVPESKGGSTTLDNLWPTHVACNEQRQSRPLDVKIEVDFNRGSDRVRRSTARVAYSSTSTSY